MRVPVTLSGRLTRAGLLVAAAAAAATVAAGCGSQVATTTSAAQPASPRPATPGGINPGGPVSTGSAALCSRQAAVTRLVVTRVTALPRNHLHFTFPGGVTVSSPERARAVARMVCGLPPMAQGVMNCPADWGVSYRLSFAAGSGSFPVVTAGAGGCGVVTGAGPVRRTASVPGFWTVLAHAMGVSGGAALQGTRQVIHDGGPVSG
jgi:type IV pilus biogenesis protein CpaD/CtpE